MAEKVWSPHCITNGAQQTLLHPLGHLLVTERHSPQLLNIQTQNLWLQSIALHKDYTVYLGSDVHLTKH